MPGSAQKGETSRLQFFNRILAGVGGGHRRVGAGAPLAAFGILPALKEEALDWPG